MTTTVEIKTNSHAVKVFMRDPRSTAVVAQKEIVDPHTDRTYYIHSGLSVEIIEIPLERDNE